MSWVTKMILVPCWLARVTIASIAAVAHQLEEDEAALAFIEQALAAPAARPPFFAYVAYSMPHIPIYASAAFAGGSPRGLYGDVIEELDSSAGRVLDTLKQLGIDDNTIADAIALTGELQQVLG